MGGILRDRLTQVPPLHLEIRKAKYGDAVYGDVSGCLVNNPWLSLVCNVYQ
jgi:hypothetical protein